MRMSHLFGRTLRDAPSDAQLPSHQLSVRAGLVRQLAQGIYSYLPLGWRVMRKIEAIIREEMDAIGGKAVDARGAARRAVAAHGLLTPRRRAAICCGSRIAGSTPWCWP